MSDPLVDATDELVLEVVAELLRRGETVATAESLTAGLLSGTIAGVPGASDVLVGGAVVYTDALKTEFAGVDPKALAEHGAVSEVVANQLAVGIRRRAGASWGVALTGVAGPGASDGVPQGTVYLGVASQVSVATCKLEFGGNRWEVRMAAVRSALAALLVAMNVSGTN